MFSASPGEGSKSVKQGTLISKLFGSKKERAPEAESPRSINNKAGSGSLQAPPGESTLFSNSVAKPLLLPMLTGNMPQQCTPDQKVAWPGLVQLIAQTGAVRYTEWKNAFTTGLAYSTFRTTASRCLLDTASILRRSVCKLSLQQFR